MLMIPTDAIRIPAWHTSVYATTRTAPPDPLTWLDTTVAEKNRFLHDVHAAFPDACLRSDQTGLRRAALPFYGDSGFQAFRLADLTRPTPNEWLFLARPGEIYWLDGTNEAIYAVNERAPLCLITAARIPYVKFFFHVVRGQLGSFLIVEYPEDICWLADASAADKTSVRPHLMKVADRGYAGDGRIRLEATVLFKNALFRTDLLIAPAEMVVRDDDGCEMFHTLGQLELCNEDLLLENLPVVEDACPEEFLFPTLWQEPADGLNNHPQEQGYNNNETNVMLN